MICHAITKKGMSQNQVRVETNQSLFKMVQPRSPSKKTLKDAVFVKQNKSSRWKSLCTSERHNSCEHLHNTQKQEKQWERERERERERGQGWTHWPQVVNNFLLYANYICFPDITHGTQMFGRGKVCQVPISTRLWELHSEWWRRWVFFEKYLCESITA